MVSRAVALAVADDLTGALEVGAAFAQHGLPGQVGGEPATGDAVHVSDWRSRHLRGGLDALAQQVPHAAFAARVAAQQPRWIVHKMDSTLRGNWALESRLVAVAAERARVVVVPAYPATGRICRDGRVLVDGVPVHQTAAGRDPLDPVITSDVGAQLAAAGYEMVTTCSDPESLAHRLGDGQGGALVVDCGDDAELAAIVAVLDDYAEDVVATGTGALAAAIAARAGGPLQRPALPSDDWLVVCGSLSARSRAQVAALAAPSITVTDTAVALPTQRPSRLVLTTPELADAGCGDLDAARTLAAVATRARRALGYRCVAVLGGDTARALLADAEAVRPRGEVVAGVPFSEVVAGVDRWQLLSKAGAFGADGLLADLLGATPAARLEET